MNSDERTYADVHKYGHLNCLYECGRDIRDGHDEGCSGARYRPTGNGSDTPGDCIRMTWHQSDTQRDLMTAVLMWRETRNDDLLGSVAAFADDLLHTREGLRRLYEEEP